VVGAGAGSAPEDVRLPERHERREEHLQWDRRRAGVRRDAGTVPGDARQLRRLRQQRPPQPGDRPDRAFGSSGFPMGRVGGHRNGSR
jgi:hypothetical protein